jgi:hypothetical protein
MTVKMSQYFFSAKNGRNAQAIFDDLIGVGINTSGTQNQAFFEALYWQNLGFDGLFYGIRRVCLDLLQRAVKIQTYSK